VVKKNIRHKQHKHVVKKKETNLSWVLVIILGIALVAAVYTDGFKSWPEFPKQNTETGPTTAPTTSMDGKPVLDLYVMSICPFGVRVEDALQPVIDDIGDHFTLNVEFIMTDQGNGNFQSLHGQKEVDGNKAQLCAREISEGYEYFDMISCMNKNAGAIPTNWESCAQEVGLDVETLRTCYDGEQGSQLLSESAAKASAAGATGSPTILLNGQRFGKSGATTTSDFLRGICGALEEKPEACSTIPECEADTDCIDPKKIGKCENPGTADAKCTYTDPVAVDFIVIGDKLCTTCDTANGIQTSLQIFPGAELKELDFEDQEAKDLLTSVGISTLPAYIFSGNLDETANFGQVSQHFVEQGDYWYIRPTSIGSNHNPSAEICDNLVDDRDGDGLVDCDDDECQGQLICKEEIANKLEVFVMSQCPFGTQALDAMKEVLENFGDQIDFQVNFIASENPDGTFSALHGQPEVDENIRELCAIKYYPDNYKYMDYIWCRNKNIQSAEWESCATDGIDANIIRACSEGVEGKQLHSENIKIANALGISASPTWMANNKFKFSGISAETVRSNICSHNELVNCDQALSGDAGAPAGSC